MVFKYLSELVQYLEEMLSFDNDAQVLGFNLIQTDWPNVYRFETLVRVNEVSKRYHLLVQVDDAGEFYKVTELKEIPLGNVGVKNA